MTLYENNNDQDRDVSVAQTLPPSRKNVHKHQIDMRICFLNYNDLHLIVAIEIYVQYKPSQCFEKEKLSGLGGLGEYLLYPTVYDLKLRAYVNKQHTNLIA